MRLKDNMNALEPALARGRQCGSDLRRMMAVIVDHRHACCPAPELETTVHTGEAFEAFTNALELDIQTNSHGNGGGCVQHIVSAGDLKMKFAQRLAFVLNFKMGVVAIAGALCVALEDAEV